MEDLSNATLAMFVVAAIAISVFGTLLSLSKINDFQSITGMLSTNTTSTAYANLSIAANAYINITDTYIQFGQIDIVSGRNSSQGIQDFWIVRNDGTVNISLRVYSTSADDQNGNGTATSGRGPFSSTSTNTGCLAQKSEGPTNYTAKEACFLVACVFVNVSYGACNRTYDALPVNALGAGSRFLVVNLSNIDGNDTAFLGVNVSIPDSEPAGNKEQDVVFLASQSS